MGQIIGKFYRFDQEAGNWSRDEIAVNAIDIDDLEGCLIIFRVNSADAVEYLDKVFTEEVIEGFGASIVVLRNDMIAGIDVIDVTESEKMTFRMLDERLARRKEKKTTYDNVVDDIIKEEKKEENKSEEDIFSETD
jgi:hypothetical protein